MKIKANVGCDEWNKKFYYRLFEVVEELPVCDEAKSVRLDPEQPTDDVRNYDFYECITEDMDGEMTSEFFAINIFHDKDIVVKTYPGNIDIFVSDKNYITDDIDTEVYTFLVDGLTFEDSDDLADYIDNEIIPKIDTCLSDDDIQKIFEKCETFLNSRIED